jgi:arsenite methyltransferase
VGHINFYSATYRLFKHPALESDCEDYGEAVIYKGTVPTSPRAFTLDAHHTIETGRVFPVCRNTLHMLTSTRYAPHFEKVGTGEQHYGLFSGCGKSIPFASAAGATVSTGGSCAPAAAAATKKKSSGGCC